MPTFGERLRRERELRGITLEEIAAATKIGTRLLRALEEEDFDKLPGGIFNKGFVRSYAKHVGIDEEQAVADYEAALDESLTPEGIPSAAAVADKARLSGPGASGNIEAATNGTIAPSAGRSMHPALTLVLLAAVAGLSIFLAWNRYSDPPRELAAKDEQAEPAPAAVVSDAAAVPHQPESLNKAAARTREAATASTAKGLPLPSETASVDSDESEVLDSGPVAMAESSGFELQIQAVQESWVSITADGRLIAAETLQASTERTVRAEREVVLKVGNAGGVQLIHNGEALPPLGNTASVRTITLTPDGVQQ